jgi:SPP1 family phage portal protein
MAFQLPGGNLWIGAFINDFKRDRLPYYNKKIDYYTGKHPILDRVLPDGKQNTKLVFQYPKLIIDTAHSYLVGKPITYANNKSVSNPLFGDTDEFVTKLQEIFIDNDESYHTAELLKNAFIEGDGYEYVYLDKEGDICLREFEATECIPVYDPGSKELVAVIRFYQMEEILPSGEKQIYFNVEVYDNTSITYYTMDKEGKVTLDLDKAVFEHHMGEVPVVHYRNTKVLGSEYGKSDIDDVETLVDEFNERASDLSNTIQYNGDPLLKLSNCTITGEKLTEMIKSRAIQVPEGADATYLTWDQQIGALEKHLERLQDCILTFSSTPKLYKDNDEGNPMSGISIKMKFSGADLKANNKERNFRKGLRKRIRLIAKLIELVEGTSYNWKDVDILFNRSIPQNLEELANIAMTLRGLVSDETLLGTIPFVVDVATEQERVAKQTTTTTDTNNNDTTTTTVQEEPNTNTDNEQNVDA